MTENYDRQIEILIPYPQPGFYGDVLEDTVELCECFKNYSARIVVPDISAINAVLDELYDIVKNSAYTVSEFVNAKPDRISFVNGSYIDIESANNKKGDSNG